MLHLCQTLAADTHSPNAWINHLTIDPEDTCCLLSHSSSMFLQVQVNNLPTVTSKKPHSNPFPSVPDVSICIIPLPNTAPASMIDVAATCQKSYAAYAKISGTSHVSCSHLPTPLLTTHNNYKSKVSDEASANPIKQQSSWLQPPKLLMLILSAIPQIIPWVGKPNYDWYLICCHLTKQSFAIPLSLFQIQLILQHYPWMMHWH